MASLIVQLPLTAHAAAAPQELGFALVSDSGMLTRSGRALPADLPKAADVLLQVPAALLSWLRIDLPKPGRAMPQAKLRAVLEGLLEDQVLADVSELHFALPQQAPGGEKTWVLACQRAYLASWVQAFEAVGRAPSRIVPQAEPLAAEQAPQLWLQGQPENAQFVLSSSDGVLAGDWAHFGALVDAPSEWAQLRAEPAMAQALQNAVGDAKPVQMLQSGQALALALGANWNLGQFEFNTSGQGRRLRQLLRVGRQALFAPEWRWARAAVLLGLLLQVLGLNVWAWQERQSLAAKQKQVRQWVTQITGASYVSDQPELQAQMKLRHMQQATGALDAGDLEPMLALLGASGPQGGALQYDAAKVLSLKGKPLKPEALQALRQRAAAAGYRVVTAGDGLDLFAEPEAEAAR